MANIVLVLKFPNGCQVIEHSSFPFISFGCSFAISEPPTVYIWSIFWNMPDPAEVPWLNLLKATTAKLLAQLISCVYTTLPYNKYSSRQIRCRRHFQQSVPRNICIHTHICIYLYNRTAPKTVWRETPAQTAVAGVPS